MRVGREICFNTGGQSRGSSVFFVFNRECKKRDLFREDSSRRTWEHQETPKDSYNLRRISSGIDLLHRLSWCRAVPDICPSFARYRFVAQAFVVSHHARTARQVCQVQLCATNLERPTQGVVDQILGGFPPDRDPTADTEKVCLLVVQLVWVRSEWQGLVQTLGPRGTVFPSGT